MNCIVILSDGFEGGILLLYGRHFTQRMSGLNLALQWHLCCAQEHTNSHGGTVFSWGLVLNVLAFTRI